MPVVQITAVPDVAEMVGVYRILEGQSVIFVVGNPGLGRERERELRRKYVLRALEILQMQVAGPRVFRV